MASRPRQTHQNPHLCSPNRQRGRAPFVFKKTRMSQPSSYSPATYFRSYEGAQPWFPGQNIDIELSAIETTTNQIRANLALIQRDDGALANGSVTFNALSPTLQTAGLAPLSGWSTGVAYTVPQAIISGVGLYQCAIAHKSGVFADDLAAGKWTLLSNLSLFSTVTLAPANFVAAGPTSGAAGAIAFRPLVSADLVGALAAPPAIGGTTPAAINATTLTATGKLTQSGDFAYLGNFNSATYPTAGQGLALGWNFTASAGEVDLWNIYTGGAGTNPAFTFKQLTGASSANDLMTILESGKVLLGTGAATTSRLALAPTSGTLEQGLYVSQALAGSSPTYTEANRLLISSDTVDAAGGIVVGFDIAHLFGGGDQGARAAVNVEARRTAASNAANATYQDVGLGFSFNGQSNNNGTALAPKGAGYAGYTSAQLSNNATYWSVLQGFQTGLGVEVGSSCDLQIGYRIGHNPNHAVKGTSYDTALDFVDDAAAAVGWDALITSSNIGGNYPLASTGTFIRTLGAQTFATGIDMQSATLTHFLRGPGDLFNVTGAGVATAAAYKLGANTFAGAGTDVHVIYDPSGHNNLTLGDATAPANFYDNDTHVFRSRAAASFVTINANGIAVAGSSSGNLTIKPPAAAGTNTITLPAGTTDFSATGGTSQVVKQLSAGAALTVGQLAAADISGLSALATSTDAANLTGTVASARLSGSYTGITGIGNATATALTVPTSWATNWSLKGSNVVPIANGANAALNGGAASTGMFVVYNASTGSMALVMTASGGASIVYQQGTEFVISSSPASGKTGIANNGSNVTTVYNNTGGACSYSMVALQTS